MHRRVEHQLVDDKRERLHHKGRHQEIGSLDLDPILSDVDLLTNDVVQRDFAPASVGQ